MTLLLAVLGASLLGSVHCAAMCGGFVCLYSGTGASRHKGAAPHAAYNAGRLVSYLLLGALAGSAFGVYRLRQGDATVNLPVAPARKGDFLAIIRCRGDLKAGRSAQVYTPVVPNLRISWMANAGEEATITVTDSLGALVQELKPKSQRGLNRTVWNMRYADLPLRGGGGEDDEGGPRNSMPGPLVMPGTYTVKLDAGGVTTSTRVVVREDPRITVTRAERRAWTDFQRQVAALATEFAPVADKARRSTSRDAQVIDNKRQAAELLARISTLYNASARWTGRPTADQRTQLAYYQQMATTIGATAF